MANELSALVDFAGDSVDHLVLTPAQSLHEAVAARVFRALGPLGSVVGTVHARIATGTYSGIRLATDRTASLIAGSVRLATGDELRLLSRTRRGRSAISAINALTGDVLETRGNPLAIPMAVHRGGIAVPCEQDALRSAFKHPTSRLAVFVHGLAQTEDDWSRRGHSFGTRLGRDLGVTPVYIHYNTGLHISDNGSRLADLIERLVRQWPVPVKELSLIGHSMGGLVARSACHQGRQAGHRWTARARHLITLGSPHAGVPLEKLVHVSSWALRAVPESRPLAQILDRRSAGIRDLRFGYLVEEDWRGEDGDRLLHNHRTEVPPLEGCTHSFITASVGRSPRHPLSLLGGDLLVRTDSAAGRGAHGSVVVSADSVIHLTGLTHFDLLDHPTVYAQIRRILAPTGA